MLETTCWCEPELRWQDAEGTTPYANGPLVIHHAADCRELAEIDGTTSAPDKPWLCTPV